MIYSLMAFQDPSSLVGPLMNVGAIGVCLVALAIYYIRKDSRYEKRIDEMLKREQDFQAQYAQLAERYRLAMEKFSQTLDAVLVLLRQQSR